MKPLPVTLEATLPPATWLLIFGLSRSTTVPEVQALLGCCREASVRLLLVPGDGDGAFGVVRMPTDRQLAARLSQQISQRSLHGRRLRAWVPVMAWI
jgi:hypothetical protein